MPAKLIIAEKTSDKRFDFFVQDGGETVPATFWHSHPSLGPKPPLTMVQHGGPLHKTHERVNWLASSIVEQTGSAVLLIDGPIHGHRRARAPTAEGASSEGTTSSAVQNAVRAADWIDDPEELLKMLAAFKRYWREDAGIDRQVLDWKVALDAVLEESWADPERIAWLGVSMGTAYGVPVCAAEKRIKAAALGMWGLEWGQETRLLEDASRMGTPVLFQIKDGDEIFSTKSQRTLFDAIGSPNKSLRTHHGKHGFDAPGQLEELLSFISQAFTV